jgi:DNA-binding MarR family transcriptional regulator
MAPVADRLFQHIAYACSEIRQSFDQHSGMSQPRRQLLILLAQAGESSHATLQQQLALDGATVTRLVKQFESAGLLNRRLDPQDNRYTLVALTASGQQAVDELRAAHSAFQARLLAGISDVDQEGMIRTLEQLRANIRALQASSPEQV